MNKATAEYADLYREHPLDREVKNNYIQLLIQSKRFAEARRLDDEILKTNPNDEDALVYKSQMQISQGDVNTATQTLQTVINDQKRSQEQRGPLRAGCRLREVGQAGKC
jgi:predicted Zn-dependent protease